MATFLSNTVNKVDKKGRVSVPSAFRAVIGAGVGGATGFQGVALYPAIGAPCLEGSDMGFFDALSRRIHERHSAVSQKSARLARRLLGSVETLAWDSEGRVLIPAGLRNYAGIGDQAKFIGIGPKFQIWDPKRLMEYEAEEEFDVEEEADFLGPFFDGGA